MISFSLKTQYGSAHPRRRLFLRLCCLSNLLLSLHAFTGSSVLSQRRQHQLSPAFDVPKHDRTDGALLLLSERMSRSTISTSHALRMAKYVPPTKEDDNMTPPAASSSSSSSSSSSEIKKKKKKPLHPKVGDFVRYYDLDGGKADGQVLIGKISFIQKNIKSDKNNNDKSSSSSSGWTVELTEMEDVGDGCYIDYASRKRLFKKALRDLANVSPVSANFVRSENAYKVPTSSATGLPLVRAEQYDIDDYVGPFAGDAYNQIDQSVIDSDGEIYNALKGKLFRYAAIAGLTGTLVTDLVKGTEDAAIYGAGFLASLVYLFFLSVKTDTIASGNAKFGKNVSNLRFAMPLIVLVGVALYNQSRGDANPVQGGNLFETVTPEQFAAAIIGFLTYRLPLFFVQIQDALKDSGEDEESSSGVSLPGSAGVLMDLATGKDSDSSSSLSGLLDAEQLPTVFLVSGPQSTGRSELMQKFIEQGNGKFVEPQKLDRVQDGAVFERLEQRGEFISLDSSGRFGLTKQSVRDAALQGATAETDDKKVAVVDADVELAKKIAQISGIRLVGVWMGLNSVQEFEDRLSAEIDRGELVVPEDETRETVIRNKIREIVKEIEYGISSGIFEFTILNENDEKSLRQLQEASTYCFK